MDNKGKLNAIIKELLERTKKGDLQWATTDHRNQYQLKIGSGWIKVYYADPDYIQSDNSDIYAVGFFNKDDENICTVGSSEFDSPDYALYHDLWETVDDKLHHRTETIESILKALDLG